ncbi:Uncharacterized protein GBIM_01791, partial [Gryllus bimaculatus]
MYICDVCFFDVCRALVMLTFGMCAPVMCALAMCALAMCASVVRALVMSALVMSALVMSALAMCALAMCAPAMCALAMCALVMCALSMCVLAVCARVARALAVSALAMCACVAGDECCVHARSVECSSACVAVFRALQTPSREARAHASHACAQENPRLLACLRNATRTTPATNSHRQLHCCDKSDVPGCREACRRVLRTATVSQEIVDTLEHAVFRLKCLSEPVTREWRCVLRASVLSGGKDEWTCTALWQCFLQTPAGAGQGPSRIDRVGMDAAKLHCCAKASRDACRRPVRAHLLQRVDARLGRLPPAPARAPLRGRARALPRGSVVTSVVSTRAVEEPCELGCDGLNYCTNFNNRPTELFRSCGRAADDAARLDVATWTRNGELSLPAAGGARGRAARGGLRRRCATSPPARPAAGGAVACALQLRPCPPHTHTNRICRVREQMTFCMHTD